MRVRIKDNRTIDLNPGDVVDTTMSSDPTVTVIGVGRSVGDQHWPNRVQFAYTYEGIRERHQLDEFSNYRRYYNIPTSYSDGTWFFVAGTGYIIGHRRPSRHSREQERSAAWGKENYEPPEGAAFEFI